MKLGHTFLGASFLSHSSTLLCALGVVVKGGSSLGNIVKGCWVFPLFEKGFPMILIVFLCMVILLMILVIATLVYGIVALFMVQVHAK